MRKIITLALALVATLALATPAMARTTYLPSGSQAVSCESTFSINGEAGDWGPWIIKGLENITALTGIHFTQSNEESSINFWVGNPATYTTVPPSGIWGLQWDRVILLVPVAQVPMDIQRERVITHELGHWVGLGHDDDIRGRSMLSPAITQAPMAYTKHDIRAFAKVGRDLGCRA